tara:strand:+ start:1588 stop:2109 length:522 start_codon:yes stop_codon:yes gene_type:complete
MKKILIYLFLLLFSTSTYGKNIVYLDVQYIIDNSELGKFYKLKIKNIQKDISSQLKKKEDEINFLEINIKNQNNILSEKEKKNKVNQLNDLLKEYKLQSNKFNKQIIENKKKYTSKILETLNPLLTNYVEKNKILLVVEKKNILIGIKSLDITKDLLKILNEETKKSNLLDEN